jgi:phosphatidylglycerol:prolipoprotein diacylglycerol transferase
LAHPLDIFKVWEGGMSFHGGFLGVLMAMLYVAHRRHMKFFEVTDLIAPLVPFGLAFGRLGNFINGELWGRPTDVAWAMIFPQAGDLIPRHPSQLYQFAGEGICLGIFLWWYAAKPRAIGQVSGMFLLGYGVFRFAAEFAREPDNFLGLLSLGLSMGQWLSVPMIAMGVFMLTRKSKSF